ncbi:MAG: N-acetylmuramoyl-L-alanine amidase, partial [Acidimicrobiia bacterium]
MTTRSVLPVLLSVFVLAALTPGGTFFDDDGNVHEGSIEAIAAVGITQGCNPPTNTRFCPDDVVNRGQMAAFLSRALELPPAPDRFVDDDGHLFEDAINRIAAAGITLGCNPPANDRFCPDQEMTRGSMAAMLARGFDSMPEAKDHFLDDDGHLFEDAINRIAAAGITLGCNPPANDRFCPDEAITRDQMATFLTRSLELEPVIPPPRVNPLVIVTPREEWGSRPAETMEMIPHTVERLTVHHAGTQTGTTGPAQFRGWQNWHMDGQGWPDIAYHVIVGIDGTVYEGRDPTYRGDTGTTYDTTGHFLVVVEGDFNTEAPTEAQVESLKRVLAWAAEEYGVSPGTIAGHRDYAATTCPGEHLHALIESGELADAVADLIADGGVDL